jgi:DNA-binding transcriptional LysR family regulator
VRQKRLTGLGRRIGVDHTTVARRIDQLERSRGCRLFERTPAGYGLTEAEQHLFLGEPARRAGRRALE